MEHSRRFLPVFWGRCMARAYRCGLSVCHLVRRTKDNLDRLVVDTNGTNWFGVNVQDTCGGEHLLHMVIIGGLVELSSNGSKVVYRIGTVMSATPLTVG